MCFADQGIAIALFIRPFAMATKTVFIPCCCGRPLMASLVLTDCDWLGNHVEHIPVQCGKICCCGKCGQAQPTGFQPRRYSVVRSHATSQRSPPRKPQRRSYPPLRVTKRPRSRSPARPYVPEPCVKKTAERQEESEDEAGAYEKPEDEPSLT